MKVELSTYEIDLLISALGWGESENYESKVYYEYCDLQKKLEEIKNEIHSN